MMFAPSVYYGLAGALTFSWVAFWALIWRFHGREYEVREVPSSLEAAFPPARSSPALVEYLLNQGEVSVNSFSATILYLVKYRALRMNTREIVGEGTGRKQYIHELGFQIEKASPPEKITLIERHVYNFLLRMCQGASSISNEEMKMYMKTHPGETAEFFRGWKDVVALKARNAGILEKNSVKWRSRYNIAGAVFVVIIAYLLNAAGFFDLPGIPVDVGVFISIGFVAGFAAGKILLRWSSAAAVEAAGWAAFRNYISDVSRLKREHPQSLAIWDEIAIYATALGLAAGMSGALPLIIPSYSDEEKRNAIMEDRLRQDLANAFPVR